MDGPLLQGGRQVRRIPFGEVNGFQTRTTLDLTPKLEIKGPGNLEIRYEHRAKLGNSPFIFDSLNGFGKLSFTYDGSWRGFYNRLDFTTTSFRRTDFPI